MSAADPIGVGVAMHTGGSHQGIAVTHDRRGIWKGGFRGHHAAASPSGQQPCGRLVIAEHGVGGWQVNRGKASAVAAAHVRRTTKQRNSRPAYNGNAVESTFRVSSGTFGASGMELLPAGKRHLHAPSQPSPRREKGDQLRLHLTASGRTSGSISDVWEDAYADRGW